MFRFHEITISKSEFRLSKSNSKIIWLLAAPDPHRELVGTTRGWGWGTIAQTFFEGGGVETSIADLDPDFFGRIRIRQILALINDNILTFWYV
jgi:hypothetical protein